MTVREAFARYGLGSDFGRGRFDRWVGKAAGQLLPVLYASAFTNLLRRKIRLLLTGCALLMGGVGFLVSMSLLASVNLTLDNETARVGYDVRLGLKEAAPEAKLATTLKDVGGVQQSETWFRSPISLTRNGSELRFQGSFGAQAVGLPAGSRMYRPLLVAGRWIEPGDADRRVLVLNAETAEASGLHVGDELTLTAPGRPSEAWSVLGLYRWVTESGYLVEPVYAPLPALWAASGRWRMATQLLVKADVASLDSEAALADTLKAKAESAGLELDYYTTSARRLQRIHAGKQFRSVVFTLLGLAAMLGTVGAIALSGALSMSVMQRRREIGVLRALGAPSVAVFQWFFLEGLFQALLAWALAIPVARVLSEVMSRQLGQTMLNLDLDYAFHWPAIWIWLGATLAIALVASTGPALGATRVTVRESLAYQ